MSDPDGTRGTGQRFMPDFLTELFRNPLDAGYAEAARRRAQRPPAPRQRTAARGVTLAVLAVTGFLFAVAYQDVLADEPGVNQARAELIEDIQARRAEDVRLQRRAERLRAEVGRARDAALGGGEAARLRTLEIAAGLAPVRGDGAEVRLTDAPAPVDPVTGQPSGNNLGKVLDRDLQDVANQLWRDGAEAIAINGERLSATATIRQAGGAILVDFQPVTGPYRVTAIGPRNLAARFDDSGTGKRFRRYASAYQMGYAVRRVRGVSLPAATVPSLEVARPLGDAPAGSPAPTPASGAPTPGGTTPGTPPARGGSPGTPPAGSGSAPPSVPSSSPGGG